MAALNLSDFLKYGEVDCCILSILGLHRTPEGGAALVSLTALIPLITQVGAEVPPTLVPLIALVSEVELPLIPL